MLNLEDIKQNLVLINHREKELKKKKKQKKQKGGTFLSDISVPAGLLLLNQLFNKSKKKSMKKRLMKKSMKKSMKKRLMKKSMKKK